MLNYIGIVLYVWCGDGVWNDYNGRPAPFLTRAALTTKQMAIVKKKNDWSHV